MDSCVVCGQKNKTTTVFREFGINILRCNGCGHIYSSYGASADPAAYFGDDIASRDHFWWREAHERMYAAFGEKFLSGRSGRLLDVGCGLGYFVKFAAGESGWEAYGLEISVPAVEFAKNKLGLKNIFAVSVGAAGFKEKYFDIITLWDVIEHVGDPHPFLKYLNSLLKDGGILFIHTPNIKIQLPKARLKKFLRGERPGAHYLEARDHLNNYSVKSLSAILRVNGFKDIEFTHLPPIQSVAGSRSVFLRVIKNAWFNIARLLAFISGGMLNLDNLFVVARK